MFEALEVTQVQILAMDSSQVVEEAEDLVNINHCHVQAETARHSHEFERLNSSLADTDFRAVFEISANHMEGIRSEKLPHLLRT